MEFGDVQLQLFFVKGTILSSLHMRQNLMLTYSLVTNNLNAQHHLAVMQLVGSWPTGLPYSIREFPFLEGWHTLFARALRVSRRGKKAGGESNSEDDLA
jgi:hypothetical protein